MSELETGLEFDSAKAEAFAESMGVKVSFVPEETEQMETLDDTDRESDD